MIRREVISPRNLFFTLVALALNVRVVHRHFILSTHIVFICMCFSDTQMMLIRIFLTVPTVIIHLNIQKLILLSPDAQVPSRRLDLFHESSLFHPGFFCQYLNMFILVDLSCGSNKAPKYLSVSNCLKGQSHVTVNKPVISGIYIVGHTLPLCSAQILVDGVNLH